MRGAYDLMTNRSKSRSEKYTPQSTLQKELAMQQDRTFLAERRKSPRYSIVDGAMKITGVHIDPATTRLLDLTKNGLSFQHMSVSALPEKILQIDLLVVDHNGHEEDLFLHKIQGEIHSVTDIEGIWGKMGGRARRYGLLFLDLSPEQQVHLEQFLDWQNKFLPPNPTLSGKDYSLMAP